MTIEADLLSGLDDLTACVALQRSVLGDRAASVWTADALTAIRRSGGLLLGARPPDAPNGALLGTLIDLHGEVDGHSARHTVVLGVHPAARQRGIAQLLRASERAVHLRDGVAVVTWEIDPLRSIDAHIAFNKLGAIGVGHRRNLYGDLNDTPNLGLATDRLLIEWWLEAPRVRAILDRDGAPPHQRLGLHQMTVVTETRVLASGLRSPSGPARQPDGRYVLAEIPEDLDLIRARDVALARRWRIDSRAVFELLFENGYVLVGLVHEGGRSFHLFERTGRGDVLGKA